MHHAIMGRQHVRQKTKKADSGRIGLLYSGVPTGIRTPVLTVKG
jgi:hypothetical protein